MFAHSGCSDDKSLVLDVTLGAVVERLCGRPDVKIVQGVTQNLWQSTETKMRQSWSYKHKTNTSTCTCCVCVCTWVDAESVLEISASHAGDSVCHSVHVWEELHGTQRILRSASVHARVMILVTLQHTHTNLNIVWIHCKHKNVQKTHTPYEWPPSDSHLSEQTQENQSLHMTVHSPEDSTPSRYSLCTPDRNSLNTHLTHTHKTQMNVSCHNVSLQYSHLSLLTANFYFFVELNQVFSEQELHPNPLHVISFYPSEHTHTHLCSGWGRLCAVRIRQRGLFLTQ